MPRQIHRLTDAVARKLARPGMHNDGNGLYLKIKDSGTKSWVLRYKRGVRDDGKPRSYFMGLGPYPAVTLAEARKKADQGRAQLRDGINPVEERRRLAPVAPKAVTFAEAAARYISAQQHGWRNEKHVYQWPQTVQEYAGGIIGSVDVAKLGTDDVLRVLEPIWTTKADTATRLRGRLEAILDWARTRELRNGENPARWKGHLKHLLPARNKQNGIQHYAALPWADVPTFMTDLRTIHTVAARSLELTILTAARTGETTGALWSEIDHDGGLWTVPAERMKAGAVHRVPLVSDAVAILDRQLRLADNAFIFPDAKRGLGQSNIAMLKLLGQMRPGLTVHGFRSSFRDWAADATDFPGEIAEACLAHTIGNAVERSYRRGDFFEKRRKLMQDWADFCRNGT
jgi:integrase